MLTTEFSLLWSARPSYHTVPEPDMDFYDFAPCQALVSQRGTNETDTPYQPPHTKLDTVCQLDKWHKGGSQTPQELP